MNEVKWIKCINSSDKNDLFNPSNWIPTSWNGKKKKRDLDGGAHKESKATSYEPLLSIESWLFYRGGWLSGIMEYHRPFPKG